MKKEKTIDFHIKWCWHAISRMYNVYASQNDMSMAIGYVLLNIDSEKEHLPRKSAHLSEWNREV